ncbi:uncharacterized protein LOC103710310 isoform X3 [Phoenix dactylifera]|uniref:Uncharacterized protein LOC103710310 isoform X3 n=1 Tax=Phoenix dactylifera TaxID=42345 RepID=A0A8B9A7S0_PHODC|nr:uncharacterized protein LOC103710310 isoform X3 [Phoenix dactylifera]
MAQAIQKEDLPDHSSKLLESITTALMELHKLTPIDKETSPCGEHLVQSTKIIDVERAASLEMPIKVAPKCTYHGKGGGILPMYYEEAIDFFLEKNHFLHNIWEDANTSKPSCTGDAIVQLLHDGPLRSDVMNVYFCVIELFHGEYTELIDNPSLFLHCEIQATVVQHLLCDLEIFIHLMNTR